MRLMASIIVLDPFTANQIAAGEVVERPVSVVKELVENALDAGAGKIMVDLSGGGLGRIMVIDDGCGMEEDDLRLAFERHATSKIRIASDLSRITTLGFRGEALPSIAAVSRVTVTTRRAGAVAGARAEIKGGALLSRGPAGCPPGTAVVVEELFYNTPARRKAMKSAPAEGALCSDLISRLALSRPDVCFELRVKGKKVFHAPGTSRLIDSLVAVYGIGQSREMVPVQAGEAGVSVRGYAGKPSFHRSSRSYQTIVVNGRFVRSPAVTAALEEAYRNMLPAGRKPVAVLSIATDPAMLDVNVHPAKLEVSLLEEEQVASLVTEALKEALRERRAIPSMQKEGAAGRTVFSGTGKTASFQRPAGSITGPAFDQVRMDDGRAREPEKKEELLLSPDPVGETSQAAGFFAAEEQPAYQCPERSSFPELFPLAQLLPAYVLARGEDGLYIIDQHAAHERILFEEYYGRVQSGDNSSQVLLIPLTIEMTPREAALLTSQIIRFADAGFILEHFGGNTFLLRGVPAYFTPGMEKEFFIDMLSLFERPGPPPGENEFLEKMAAVLACREAVKAGGKLSSQSMGELIRRLSEADNPLTCPHGRPTVVRISFREIDGRFKR